MKTFVKPIAIHREQGRHIWLPHELLEAFHLSPKQSVILKLGQLQCVANVRLSPHIDKLFVSHEVARSLCLPAGKLHIRAIGNHSLQLGPVIGLLSTYRLPMFTAFLKEGLDKGTLFYFFRPADVDWARKQVVASMLQKDQEGKGRISWKRQRCPLPDVIYERVPNRQSEKRRDVRLCLEKLRHLPGAKVFNQGFYDKWDIYKRLVKNPSLRPYLPETSLAHPTLIKEMLSRYQAVYIKPIHGSLGLGIIRAHQLKSGLIQCHFHQQGAIRSRIFPNIIRLFHEFPIGPSRYLVQPAISLIQYNHAPVDFRVHLHRNGNGEWQVVGVGAKVARHPRSITTHVRTGGSFMPAEAILKAAFAEQAQGIMDVLKKTAILFAEEVANSETGPIGELGLDMGIDINGNPWLFEINAKPGRHIFKSHWLKTAALESARSIVDYALYLSGFKES
jgi:hypothetical protein